MKNKKKYIENLLEEINNNSLYFIEFYSGQPLYVIGTNLKAGLAELNLNTDLNIKLSVRVEDFSNLLRLEKQFEKIIINNRQVCKTKSFICLFDNYEEQPYWLCINNETGQQIRLNE